MADQLSSSFEELTKAKRVPGIGAIVLDKSGKRLYDSSFGTLNANEDNAKPFTNDTQLLIWSCTKLITSLCTLQLVEQGKISLNDPVKKYLTKDDFQVCERLDENRQPVLRKPKTEMTLLHLITHTSGLTYDFFGDDKLMHDYRAAKDQPRGAYLNPSAEWQYNDVFLAFDPGVRHHYGTNIDRLGFIIEEVSGLKLEDYIAKNICEPLGMKNTGPQFQGDDWLKVHLKDGEGKLTAVEAIQPAKEPWKYGGGHFLCSSLSDYSQVLLALLNEGKHPGTGKSILKPETVKDYVFKDLIPEVGCTGDGIGVISAPSLVPGVSNAGDVGSIMSAVPRGWSAGLMINNEDASSARKAGSGAWAGLGNLYYIVDPKSGVAGIIGTSIMPFLDSDVVGLFEKMEKFAYAG